MVGLTFRWVARGTHEVLDVVGLDVVLRWGQLSTLMAYPGDSSASITSHIPGSRAGRGAGTRRRWARSG